MKTCVKKSARTAFLATVTILSVVAGAPIPSSAQSPEQTVAFMLWGVEEGPRTRQVGRSRWKADGHNGDESIEIAQLTNCLFSVSNQMRRASTGDVLEFDYRFDFGAVHDYSAWPANGRDQRIIVKIEGSSWYSKTVLNKATGRVLQRIS